MREFPKALTPDLAEVLGWPNFKCSPIAHAFVRAGRAEIKPRAEDEQAFVLHWLVGLVLEHGALWRRHADGELAAVLAECRAKSAAEPVS